jgi:asparagine synthase (glutamine-hydrolysing)
MVRYFDEPFGNPTSLLLYQLSEFTRKHVTVALVGDAGDEVFLGYPRYQGALLSSGFRRVPSFLRAFLARTAEYLPESANGNHFNRRLKEFLSGSRHSPEEMYLYWISYFTPEMRKELYTADLKQKLAGYDSSKFLHSLFQASQSELFLDRISYVDLRSFLPFNLLRYSDRMSMAHSLEVRVPFTDHKLVEFSASLPFQMKLRGLRTKYILRRAVDGLVPTVARTRGKIGLNPPMGLWLKGRLFSLLNEYLSPESIRRRGYFSPETVHRMIDEHQKGRRDYSPHLWALIVFEEWHRQYLD